MIEFHNEKKRFLIYNTETLEVESVPILGFPEYREYVITDPSETADMLEAARVAQAEGHRVRVINKSGDSISSDQDEDKSGEKLVVIENKEVDATNRGVNATQSKEDQCRTYLNIQDIPEDEHDQYMDMLFNNDIFNVLGGE